MRVYPNASTRPGSERSRTRSDRRRSALPYQVSPFSSVARKRLRGAQVSILPQPAETMAAWDRWSRVLTRLAAVPSIPGGCNDYIATRHFETRAKTEWRAVVARYQGSDVSRSIVQMITTLVAARGDAVRDVPVARPALLDNAPARASHGGPAGPHVHHHARLRPRLVSSRRGARTKSSGGSPACSR